MPIKAVGFDLDGTLYPAAALYLRMTFKAMRSAHIFSAFKRVRHRLRDDPAIGRAFRANPPESIEAFHRYQARIVAGSVRMGEQAVYEHIERWFYRGAEDCFSSIRLFPGVRLALESLRSMGLPLGLLSDFPAERKLSLSGLDGLFDTVATSESAGLLKPAPEPFWLLASALGAKPEHVLYVGNSERYDVQGAKAAGMQTAFISPSGRARAKSGADFAFGRYHELSDWIKGRLA